MFFKGFAGGFHLKDEKDETNKKPVKKASSPKTVVIPLLQHTGNICEPLVGPGDQVKMGQKIGDSKSPVSAPIHSSVSGKVLAVEPRPHPFGKNILSIIIEPDGLDTMDERVKPCPDISSLSAAEIINVIREAGIVGLGGGMFPTHIKLTPPKGRKIDTVVINGAECEPMLNCDNRTMIEWPLEVVYGLRTLMKASGASSGIIAIEDNKPEAIKQIRNIAASEKNISVSVLRTKYPQGGEKQLIKALFGKEVPSGGLPADVGVIVNNAGTAVAVSDALKTGLPLIKRVLTVTGKGVREPSNLLVKIGTSVEQIINDCGGLLDDAKKVIMGGPMTGISLSDLTVPVIKGTSGIVVLTSKEVDESRPSPCIRCAKCVDACPAGILPNFLGDFSESGQYDKCAELNAKDCIECGLCTYVCPTKRNLTQLIKLAKLEIAKKK